MPWVQLLLLPQALLQNLQLHFSAFPDLAPPGWPLSSKTPPLPEGLLNLPHPLGVPPTTAGLVHGGPAGLGSLTLELPGRLDVPGSVLQKGSMGVVGVKEESGLGGNGGDGPGGVGVGVLATDGDFFNIDEFVNQPCAEDGGKEQQDAKEGEGGSWGWSTESAEGGSGSGNGSGETASG